MEIPACGSCGCRPPATRRADGHPLQVPRPPGRRGSSRIYAGTRRSGVGMRRSRLQLPGGLPMLLAGLALAAGCDRAPSVPPPAGPARSDVAVVVRPEEPPRTGPAVDPKGDCCDRDAVADGTGKGTRPAEAESLPAGVTIPDVGLVNQDGRQVRFAADLLKGKIVAVNFVFTSCKGICPPLGANF